MCGICGFSDFGPQASPPSVPPSVLRQKLAKMNQTLYHRGPDGAGLYHDPLGRMHLAHRRLSIIDVEHGQQPMSNADGSLWITFNGEIYNYQALKASLSPHRDFQTDSDTEVILHLYEEYGLDLFQHLNGMFALALWDERRGRLILARDRLGVKPLYWAYAQKRLFFASEMKAILHWEEVPTAINERALSHYLSLRAIPEPWTIYQGISTLPPAHYLVWEPHQAPKIQRYWKIDFTPTPWSNETEICERLEALLVNATQVRLQADVPVGALLSGGVDSSLIVALARQSFSGELQTFSLGYKNTVEGKDDLHYARLIAQQYQTTHHEHRTDAAELLQHLPDIMNHLEQPFSGVVSPFFLMRLVKQHVKVVLTGEGADEQFGSYGHHRLVWPLQQLAQLQDLQNMDETDIDLSPLRGKLAYVRQFANKTPWELRACFGAFPNEEKCLILHPDYRHWVERYSTPDYLSEYWTQGTSQDPLNQMLETDIQTSLVNEVLFFGDRLSMAHSVESRSPFLDYRLVELSASIPGNLKIKGAVLKYILKRVASKHLPPSVIERPKEGFVLPKHLWLRGPLKDWTHDLLSPGALQRHGYFDINQVQRLLNEHHHQKRDHAFRIWTLVMFQLWYNRFISAH